ncbi:ABC transporter permease [Bryobacter aggregatus]|uniref:ABC transporter permease n=1 Tax=Bryobacter aggregatus TaxID=360054 RepID=UPI0004E10ECF|nr:ABC transporter permease [Bryobacter aggregatus]
MFHRWLRRKDPIREELAFHLEELKREFREAGDSEVEAARKARLALGQDGAIEDQVQDTHAFHRMGMIVRHMRFALRSYRRNGDAYLYATGILALGIGLSVAMFSLVHAVVLNPLPFPQQENVHLLWKRDSQANTPAVGELAVPELEDLRATIPQIAHVALIPAALYGNGRVLQVGRQEPVQIESCPATADLFRVLGVAPMLGRNFETADEATNASPVVILSHGVWRNQFGARRDVIGQTIQLNGLGHQIIGVMGADVDFPRGAGLWVPLRQNTDRSLIWLQAVVRVQPGVTRGELQNAAERTVQLQYRDHPEIYSQTQHAVVTPLADFLTGSSKSQLLISLLASLLLLVSAAVSAGNLFLSRALVRRREVATRISIGASPAQILLQFGVEGLVAASVATLIGSMLATAMIRLLIHWAPADIPRIETAGLDGTAVTFAATTALLATIACSVGPALLLRRKNLDQLLRDGGARTAGSRSGAQMQNGFVFLQAALTVAILGVGLLLSLSYRAMQRTETGFAHRDTLTMNLALRGQRVNAESRRRFYRDLLDHLRARPEVTSAAAVLLRPLEGAVGWDTQYSFEYEAGSRDPHLITTANFEAITPHYFETVGTPFLSGRDFNDHDTESAEKVVIISRSLAQKVRASGREPLGQKMRSFGAWRKVVGVVADARYRGVVQSNDDIYVPDQQVTAPTNYLVLRGTVPTAELLQLVRNTLRQIDPTQAIAGEATMEELLERNTARSRFNASLLMIFSLGAVLLAGAGIHSVMRESLAVRRKEIAVRLAVGAGRGRLVAQTTRNALLWVLSGEIAGLVVAISVATAASDLLYRVSPTDPAVLASVLSFIFLVAVFSSFVPAWISASQDPRASLHAD